MVIIDYFILACFQSPVFNEIHLVHKLDQDFLKVLLFLWHLFNLKWVRIITLT